MNIGVTTATPIADHLESAQHHTIATSVAVRNVELREYLCLASRP